MTEPREVETLAVRLHRDIHDAPGLGGPANNRAAITQRAQVTNLRRVRTGSLELHWLSARRQEQRIKFAIAAIGELDALLPRIDRGNPRIQEQFDLVLAIEVHRVQRDPFLVRSNQAEPATAQGGRTCGGVRWLASCTPRSRACGADIDSATNGWKIGREYIRRKNDGLVRDAVSLHAPGG
jgi:hypothetical protein